MIPLFLLLSTLVASIKNPFSFTDQFNTDAVFYAPLNGSFVGTNSPQVFLRKGKILHDWVITNILRDLAQQGYTCSGNSTMFVCDPAIGYDTIDASCYFDYYQVLWCVAVTYNRQFNQVFHFRYRKENNCDVPQYWKRKGAKPSLDLDGEPFDTFLKELNAKGYDCFGDSERFSCANPIEFDSIRGSCLGTMSSDDPVICKVDKLYNHFTFKKLVPCLYPKSKE